MCIVDECCRLLSDVESCTDKVANTALLALKTLETALSKQDEFLTILRSNTAHSVMATPLDDLLLGINPRSRKADHYVNIARYNVVMIKTMFYLNTLLTVGTSTQL